VADRVLEAAGGVHNLSVLDAGCGTGELCRRLADRGARMSGIDLCPGLLARARSLAPDAALARADAHALPFSAARFDLATSVLVLHYLEDPGRALAELARVVRPGGRLVVCDRICSADPVLRAAQLGVERLRNPLIHRILSSEELEHLLEAAGFEIDHHVEFRRSEMVEAWVAGTDPRRAVAVREEISRLQGRDLGGFRVAPGDCIELRLALMDCRRIPAESK
jgi:ubiquinone/menaquinone biosynthesis C-methylase UbiE